MAMLLSAQTGTVITSAELLGETAADVAARTTEAEKAMKVLEKRMKKVGIA